MELSSSVSLEEDLGRGEEEGERSSNTVKYPRDYSTPIYY